MATFEWNESKSLRNQIAHDVAFEEAVSAFADPLGLIVEDLRHSGEESRYALIRSPSANASSSLRSQNEGSGSG